MKSFTPVRWVVLLTVLINILTWNSQMAMWRDPRTFESTGWGYNSDRIEYMDYMFDTHFFGTITVILTTLAACYCIGVALRRRRDYLNKTKGLYCSNCLSRSYVSENGYDTVTVCSACGSEEHRPDLSKGIRNSGAMGNYKSVAYWKRRNSNGS